jgi:hypothetical protein
VALVDLAVLVVLIGLLGLGGWALWNALRSSGPGGRVAERDRAWLAEQIARARWAPAHDEVEGTTRVLLRRSYVGLDGRPAVLEERVFDTFPAGDPAWEARFTETMSRARFRCSYLNAEELPG